MPDILLVPGLVIETVTYDPTLTVFSSVVSACSSVIAYKLYNHKTKLKKD